MEINIDFCRCKIIVAIDEIIWIKYLVTIMGCALHYAKQRGRKCAKLETNKQ